MWKHLWSHVVASSLGRGKHQCFSRDSYHHMHAHIIVACGQGQDIIVIFLS